jgi:hypothetical protein
MTVSRHSEEIHKVRRTVPRNYLNKGRLHLQHLFPAESRQVLADESPVLGVEVGEKPGGDG